jgi:23S rRNA pseudouridine1911/1915/1917 synthase
MKQAMKFHVDTADLDQRLDRFLALRLGGLSRMRIGTLLEGGACRVNGEVGAPGLHLRDGDVVEIVIDEDGPTAMTPEDIPLDIVYEDSHLLVINKRAGMLVHPTRTEKTGTLANALAYYLNRAKVREHAALSAAGEGTGHTFLSSRPLIRPGLAHRLDRATSGLMVITKQERALSILTRHFHRRLVEKCYLALVHGPVERDEMTIDAPIGRFPLAHPKWNVSPNGKPAETRLRVIERRGRVTLVELEPVTGRTNQLRIHCAHIGCAIVGDDWYGSDRFPRLCLHAARLGFHHPSGGEWMEFSSPLPVEIEEQGRSRRFDAQ